jgi:hypothetical protein
MAVNKELVEKVLDHLREHPQEWDQDQWFCETTACFGGRALLMSGYRMINTAIEQPTNIKEYRDRFGPNYGDWEMVDDDGNAIFDFADRAAKVLGIPWPQAGEIFGCMSVDFDEFEGIVRDVVEGVERADA